MDGPSALLTGLIALLLSTVFVHFAARLLMEESSMVKAFLAVLVGVVLAGLVQIGGASADWPRSLVVFLALAAFALGLAVAYRASWLKGALLGFVAWILWAFSYYLVDQVLL